MNKNDTIAPLPIRHMLCGPIATRHIAWFATLYLLIALTGFFLSIFDNPLSLRIFGLGLMFPGGGFLVNASTETLQGWLHIGMILGGGLSFSMAVMGWFATGNVLLPPLTWLALAVAASTMGHSHHMPAASIWGAVSVVLGLATLSGAIVYVRQLYARKARAGLNKWLQEKAPVIAVSFSGSDMTLPMEFSSDDTKRMRFLLDRALQPIENFDGFEWLDQFQTAAVRYQLNFLGYALSMAQYTHLPACSAYVTDAQRLLINKLTDYRIWRYWALENSWGNLRFNSDPVAHENIMFTGFAATQMAMYQRASGKNDFNTTGSFALHHPSGKRWSYSLPELVGVLKQKADDSPYHLIACEPNWVYPLCNMIGAAAIKAETPSIWAGQQDRFRHHLEHEFMDLHGRIIPCRSRYTGLALPIIGGAMPQALPCFFLNAILPDIAMRQWLLLRNKIMKDNRLRRELFWRIDTGNYRFSRAAAYAATALAAAELGDDEVRIACLEALDEECPTRINDGYFYRPQASVWAHAVEFLARSTVQNSFRSMIASPHDRSITPHISHATYPAVLISAATYADGKLRAILYKGTGSSRQEITIGGLKPQVTYRCQGTEQQQVRADIEGKAIISVILNGRVSFEMYEIG